MSAEETKERRKSFKSEDNKALAQRSREIVSQRNPDLLEEMYAADIVWHEPDQDVQGLEEAKQFYSIYLSAFPDLNATVEDVLAEGDKAVTRWTIRGTHQGEIEEFGPPTGEQVEINGITIHRIEGSKIGGVGALRQSERDAAAWARQPRGNPLTGKEGEKMQPETIRRTVRLFEEQPGKAKTTPTVKARTDGSQAAMEAGPFSWSSDLPEPIGGTNQAPSPTALLLSALAGCGVVFIRDTLAPQLGVRVDAVEAKAQCEADARGLLGMAGAEPDLKNIRLDIKVQSPDDESDVQKLYEAWRERCPIYLALTKAMDVSLNMETTQA